jgi:hypothetical protein
VSGRCRTRLNVPLLPLFLIPQDASISRSVGLSTKQAVKVNGLCLLCKLLSALFALS